MHRQVPDPQSEGDFLVCILFHSPQNPLTHFIWYVFSLDRRIACLYFLDIIVLPWRHENRQPPYRIIWRRTTQTTIMAAYQNWKTYQKDLQRKARRKKGVTRNGWIFISFAVLVLGALFSRVDLSTGSFKKGESNTVSLAKQDFWNLIDPKSFLNAPVNRLDLPHQASLYSLETTIDTSLQQYMAKKLGASKSPAVAFVAMNPANGEVLSLIEFNTLTDVDQVCLNGQFPAASIFKIVSAAAAIEDCNYSAESTLPYNGRKHTLYKFAQSINPTFGKLGIFRLKKDLLEKYADRFGFNQPIDFELPIAPSGFLIGDKPYQWAEIACGFNRTTVMSPIHGAMIAAVVLNGGKLIEPTIVRQMTGEENVPVYHSTPRIVRQVVSPETSEELKKLMAATISRGTSRRAFRGYRRDRVLSKLFIGGKTGSIKNRTDDLLYDWFVGFGEEKQGDRKLAFAILVVHDKLLRTRAQEYARLALRQYFKNPPNRS